MELVEAIWKRQTPGPMTEQPVSKEALEKLLTAAVQAPNHFKLRPWRFLVFLGDGRKRLGKVLVDLAVRKSPQLDEAMRSSEHAKAMRAPAVIAVTADAPVGGKGDKIENICATAAAVQNLLLAAVDMGLAAHWRTGDAVRDAGVKQDLGLASDQELIGFIYVGHPATELPRRERPGFEDRATWFVT